MEISLFSRMKIWEWTKRYGPQELVALVCALIAANLVKPILLASHFTWAKVLAVSVVVIVDGVAFYAYGFVREWLRHRARTPGERLAMATRDVAFEYAIASVCNLVLFRPYFVYHLPLVVGDINAGIVLAQVFAGITFYILVIPFYELRKRMFRDKSRRTP